MLMSNSKDTFLRLPSVIKRTGLGRSTIYRQIQVGTFPKMIKLSERTSVWAESSINDWIEQQKAKAGLSNESS